MCIMNNTTSISPKMTINVLGSCVVRDTFGFHENDGGYKIQQNVNGFSPIFSLKNTIDIDLNLYNALFLKYKEKNPSAKPYWARCRYLDLSGNVINYINSNKSDFLIMDVAFARYDYDLLENGKYICKYENDFVDFLIAQKIIPPIKKKNISFDDIDANTIEHNINDFINKILQIYEPDKIILYNNKSAYFGINFKKNSILRYNKHSADKLNKRYKYCFHMIKEMLKGCHTLDFPTFVMGDLNHKWGASLLHYTPETYDMLLSCVDTITSSPDCDHSESLKIVQNKFLSDEKNNYFDIIANYLISDNNSETQAVSWNNFLLHHKENIPFFVTATTNINQLSIQFFLRNVPQFIHYEVSLPHNGTMGIALHIEGEEAKETPQLNKLVSGINASLKNLGFTETRWKGNRGIRQTINEEDFDRLFPELVYHSYFDILLYKNIPLTEEFRFMAALSEKLADLHRKNTETPSAS